MNIDYKEIGKRISARRKELGLKQYEVCETVDVNYKYLSNLETGRSAPSLELIMKLCDALQTTPDYFLVGVTDGNLYDRDIAAKIGMLGASDKKMISDIVDLFVKKNKV